MEQTKQLSISEHSMYLERIIQNQLIIITNIQQENHYLRERIKDLESYNKLSKQKLKVSAINVKEEITNKNSTCFLQKKKSPLQTSNMTMKQNVKAPFIAFSNLMKKKHELTLIKDYFNNIENQEDQKDNIIKTDTQKERLISCIMNSTNQARNINNIIHLNYLKQANIKANQREKGLGKNSIFIQEEPADEENVLAEKASFAITVDKNWMNMSDLIKLIHSFNENTNLFSVCDSLSKQCLREILWRLNSSLGKISEEEDRRFNEIIDRSNLKVSIIREELPRLKNYTLKKLILRHAILKSFTKKLMDNDKKESTEETLHPVKQPIITIINNMEECEEEENDSSPIYKNNDLNLQERKENNYNCLEKENNDEHYKDCNSISNITTKSSYITEPSETEEKIDSNKNNLNYISGRDQLDQQKENINCQRTQSPTPESSQSALYLKNKGETDGLDNIFLTLNSLNLQAAKTNKLIRNLFKSEALIQKS